MRRFTRSRRLPRSEDLLVPQLWSEVRTKSYCDTHYKQFLTTGRVWTIGAPVHGPPRPARIPLVSQSGRVDLVSRMRSFLRPPGTRVMTV